jgi:hypothetical protein
MSFGKSGALVASLGAVVLVVAANEASARSAAAPRGSFASMHPVARPFNAHSFRHHRGGGQTFWPGVDGTYYGPDGTPMTDVAPVPPASNDVHYTTTYDVPWDWAHRFPPNVTPSDRPYVSRCTAEAVTVPGRGGEQQTVNVTRCY